MFCLPKTLMNRFNVEELIGKGGFGAVYRGKDIRNNYDIAIKFEVISKSRLATEAEVSECNKNNQCFQ